MEKYSEAVVEKVIEQVMNNEISPNEENGNIFDLTNGQDQEYFLQKTLDVINSAYEKYKHDKNKIMNNKKYANEYKTEKSNELKEQFMLFKYLQLDNAETEIGKIEEHLRNLDNIEKSKQDKLLTEITKMNLLNMINISMQFEDNTLIKNNMPAIVKDPDLKFILENKIKNSKKNHLIVDIEKEYYKQNAKYINLEKLKERIKLMKSHKDTVFVTSDMKKIELIK